jgi:hypothetical protein
VSALRLAYADPPYLGCSHFYPEHPEAPSFDSLETHNRLLERLDRQYDGWAYSLSSTSLATILPSAPAGTRIAAWVKPFAAYKKNVRIAYTWEPVLFKPGRDRSRDGAPVGRDHLSCSITLKRGLTGAKPEAFCDWILTLLGFVPGDEVVDLFPGTGVMSRVASAKVLA